MTGLYWLMQPVVIGINYLDGVYKTLKRMLNLGTSAGDTLTSIGRDLDIERYHHIDRVLRIRAFNSVAGHKAKGSIKSVENECGNFYGINARVIDEKGGLFAKVIVSNDDDIVDLFDRADGPIGDAWTVFTGSVAIASHKVKENSGTLNSAECRHKTVLHATARHWVHADFDITSGTGGFDCYLTLRCQDQTHYKAYAMIWSHTAEELRIGYRDETNSMHYLGATVVVALTHTVHTLRLEVENIEGGVQLRAYIDGVLKKTVNDTVYAVTAGNYAGFLIANHSSTANDIQVGNFGAGDFIDDRYWRGICGEVDGAIDIIMEADPAVILSPWLRHLLVYDEYERCTDEEKLPQTTIEYVTISGMTTENSDAGALYIFVDAPGPGYINTATIWFFKTAADRDYAASNPLEAGNYAVARAVNDEKLRLFVRQWNNSGLFGIIRLGEFVQIKINYYTRRHLLTGILENYVPAHTRVFLDGYRQYHLEPYGIHKINSGLEFVNFVITPTDCMTWEDVFLSFAGGIGYGTYFTYFDVGGMRYQRDRSFFFYLRDGYENQVITILSEPILLDLEASPNWILDIVYWIKAKAENYFYIEVRQGDDSGGTPVWDDWRTYKNNSNLRDADGALKVWQQFRIKFMVKEAEDLVIENFVYKQVLEYLSEFFE